MPIIINGFSFSLGDKVRIGDKYAKSHSYTEVVGEVCTYHRPATTKGRHIVHSKHTGLWFIEEEDIQPARVDTNAEAIRLLRRG